MNNVDEKQLTSHQLNYVCLSLFKNELNMLWILFFELPLEEPTAVLIFAKLIDLWHKTFKAYIGKSVTYSVSVQVMSNGF